MQTKFVQLESGTSAKRKQLVFSLRFSISFPVMNTVDVAQWQYGKYLLYDIYRSIGDMLLVYIYISFYTYVLAICWYLRKRFTGKRPQSPPFKRKNLVVREFYSVPLPLWLHYALDLIKSSLMYTEELLPKKTSTEKFLKNPKKT